MKTNYIGLIFLWLFLFIACSESDEPIPPPEPPPSENEAEKVMEQLWSTSCLNYNSPREKAFEAIQGYADLCSDTYFKNYLKSLDAAAGNREKYDPILTCYKVSFDKVVEEVRSTQVENGSTVIWMLYNMGYLVKTPDGCFGIDICHRYAEQLEPYLDFLCVTHNHSDHYSTELINQMFDNNKPVLSNYLKKGEGYAYTSSSTSAYTIGRFTVTTNINDHNTSLTNFVTTFQVDCGSNGGNLVLMHVGDSNYKASQYHVLKPVNVFMARYAPNALTENQVIGEVVTPEYVFLSHILELAHAGVDESRWPIAKGLERASQLNCRNAVLPFWGEKLIWKNNQLTKERK
ncbi:MAG: MBL fold metallo-hydrolase [Bacteroides sp.]|nr:MBL fold metallo-hydrolase [Bacteroides sp.]